MKKPTGLDIGTLIDELDRIFPAEAYEKLDKTLLGAMIEAALLYEKHVMAGQRRIDDMLVDRLVTLDRGEELNHPSFVDAVDVSRFSLAMQKLAAGAMDIDERDLNSILTVASRYNDRRKDDEKYGQNIASVSYASLLLDVGMGAGKLAAPLEAAFSDPEFTIETVRGWAQELAQERGETPGPQARDADAGPKPSGPVL